MKTMLLQKILSVVFLAGLTVQSAFAEEQFLDVEYYSTMPSSFLKDRAREALTNLLKKSEFSVEQFDIGSEPKVQFSKVRVLTESQNALVQPTKRGVYFQAQGAALHLDIGEIKIDQVIEKYVNGIIARIHIYAVCSGVSASLAGPQTELSGEVFAVVDEEWIRPQLQSANVKLGNIQFEFSKMKCEGASGFDQLLVDTVQQMLSDTTVLEQKISSEYLALLQKQLSSWGYHWKKPTLAFELPVSQASSGKKLEAWLYPQTLEISESGGWRSFGVIRIAHPSTSQPSCRLEFSVFARQEIFSLAGLIGQDRAALIFPDEALTALAEIYLSPDMWSMQSSSKEIPAFHSLLQSRIKQFFVWPDLWNFSKKSEFYFQSGAKSPSRLQWDENDTIYVNTNVFVKMFYSSSLQFLPYAQFDVRLRSHFKVSIEAGQAVVTSINPQIKVGYEWDPAYCEKDGRCGRISKNILAKSAASYMTDRRIEFPLPKLEATFGVKIEPKALLRDSGRRILIFQF